jgi:glycerate dehydrogenase
MLDRSKLHQPAADALRLIVIAATGTDSVDLQVAQTRGIKVANVPGYATHSVAQFTMALVLELATHAGLYAGIVRVGAWEKSPMFNRLDFPCVELYGKTLGIIGYGNIGRLVGDYARAFGMEILVSARPGNNGSVAGDRTPFKKVLERADFLTLHCPLTMQTKGLIDDEALNLMKPTAFLINTARGALVDELALIRALEKKRLAGAALDVLTKEPPPADDPLIIAAKRLDNLLITPHCAWTAREARQRLVDDVAENIAAYTRGDDRNRVV